MRYKISILNTAAGLFITGIIFYSIFYYRQLSKEEGWGIVAMVGLSGIAVVLLILDFIIQQILKDRIVINIIGTFLLITAILLVVLK